MSNVIDLAKVRADRQATRIANSPRVHEDLWPFFGVPVPSSYCPECGAPMFTRLPDGMGTSMSDTCDCKENSND